MSTPNPLIPQGSLHKSRGNSNVRIAVATIVAIHIVFFGGLLLQGCKRDNSKINETGAVETNTNTQASYQLPPLTNSNDLYFSSPSNLPAEHTNPAPYAASPEYSTPVPRTNLEGSGGTPSAFLSEPAPSGETKEYTIQRGDILAKIAKENNVSLSALLKANPGIEPTRLKVGAKINIPAPSAAPAAAAAVPGTISEGNVYTVKSGDNLTRIARHYGVTVSALRNANGLRVSQLKVGQKLTIPAKGETTNAATGPAH
jgi:LysM repeat protein